MSCEQLNLFEFILDNYKIDKPIRLIELFSGIGAQAKALENLGVKFESWKTCDWAVPSIHAYKAIHSCVSDDSKSAWKNFDRETKNNMVYGVSSNYNEPISKQLISKKSDEWIDDMIATNIATNNLINIMNVHAEDLEIINRDKFCYVMTYSFPCQDLSLAGKRAGMSVSQAEGGTRSGLLWEIERILREAKEEDCLPHVLLMENVPEIISYKNVRDFRKWCEALDSLGYSSFCEILNAKHFGIPQNRRRCFMVSFLGQYNYTFPKKIGHQYILEDFLEDNVDERYYLSQKMIDCFMSDGTGKYPRKERFLQNINRNNQDVGNSITTLAGNRATDNFVVEKYGNKALDETLERNDVEAGDFIDAYNRNVKKGVAGTITTRVAASNDVFIAEDSKDDSIKIRNATEKGYLLAKEGDGVDISTRMQYHRGTVQSKSCQTIATMGGENVEVVVADAPIKKVGNYGNGHHAKDVFDPEGVAPTITTGNHGLGTAIIDKENDETSKKANVKQEYVGTYDYAKSKSWCPTENDRMKIGNKNSNAILASGNQAGVMLEETVFTETEKKLFTEDGNVKRYIGSDKVDEFKEGQMATTTFPNGYGHGPRTHNDSIALNTIDRPCVKHNLRIRKLTPLECIKLMGFTKSDYLAMRSIGQTDSQIYHEAGDSIVVTVLMAIFGKLCHVDYESIIKKYVDTLVEKEEK